MELNSTNYFLNDITVIFSISSRIVRFDADMSLLRGSADFCETFPCHPLTDDSFPRIIFLVDFSRSDFRVKNLHFSLQIYTCSKQKVTSYL